MKPQESKSEEGKPEISPNIHKIATLLHFLNTLENPNIGPELGLLTIDKYELDTDMHSRADFMAEWSHWTEAARATAALNPDDAKVQTKEEIGDTYAKFCMNMDAVTIPRYKLTVAMMKFATHQVKHAFGRTEGLPYPNADGTRTYNTAGPAVEIAVFGSSRLEDKIDDMWPAFILETAKRVGFDIGDALDK